jgi:Mg2+ and Co2+ transporter CorA
MKNFFIIHLLFIKLSTNNQNQIERETSANIVSNQTILAGLTTTFIFHHKSAFVNIAKKINIYHKNQTNHNLAKVTTHIIADISNNDVNLIEKANHARSQIIRIIYKKPHPCIPSPLEEKEATILSLVFSSKECLCSSVLNSFK